MTGFEIGLTSLALMLVLIWFGMHIGVVLTALSFLGVWLLRGDFEVAGRMLAISAYESINGYFFGVVPLFVLMGLMVGAADMGRDCYRVAEQAFRRVRGGLGIATVAANAAFSAVTGISIASAAVFTKIAVPEMLRLGYTPRFSVGVVAGSSVLGMLIPPSLLLILYAFLAEQSIGDMFLAGVVPGLIMAGAMALGILVVAHRWPAAVGGAGALTGVLTGDEPSMGIAAMASALFPLVSLILAVLGGIYGGFFTPTEAGAVGALGATLIAAGRRRLTWPVFWRVLKETGHVTVSICFLLIAASIYTRMLAMTGIPQWAAGGLTGLGLGYFGFLAVYVLVLVVMGMFLDATSIMLITTPLVLPIAQALGMDLVWFGIVTVIAVEIGLLTPPLGLSVFVVKSTLDDDRIALADVFAGAAPFVLVMLAVLALLAAFPVLVL